MNLYILIIYVFLGIGIFFMSGYVGSMFSEYEKISAFELKENCQSFNLIYRILFPVISVFIFVNIIECIGIQLPQYWLIILFYWLSRIFFIILMGRFRLTNKIYLLITFILSNLSGIFVYNISMKDHEFLLPTKDNLVSQFWIIIILFLYKLLGEIQSAYVKNENRKNRLENYALKKLNELYPAYILTIRNITSNIDIIKIIFSIMIVEDFNRPKFIRFFEKIFPSFFKTKGIMQITTDRNISDDESVSLASKQIIDIYNTLDEDTKKDIDYGVLNIISRDYNKNNDYPLMIREIYNIIKKNKIFVNI